MSLEQAALLILVLSPGLLLLPRAFAWAVGFAFARGAWSVAGLLTRVAPYVLGQRYAETLAFDCAVSRLREEGKLAEAAALAKARIAEEHLPAWSRNTAIDILISAGEYKAALSAEPSPYTPSNAHEALSLTLIQINLAEAEYNLGRWEDAETRLRDLDLACQPFPMTRAGLLQQRAWIAAHRGRSAEALELCTSVKPTWLPAAFRAEYHFTRAVAYLAAGRVGDADAALREGERAARRLSSKRNALLLRARIASARGDWLSTKRFCQEAANHPFRGQGGDGYLLWGQALMILGDSAQSEVVFRLLSERDPESEAAQMGSALAKPPEP